MVGVVICIVVLGVLRVVRVVSRVVQVVSKWSESQVIKITSYLPMVGGSLRVLRPLPTVKLVAMI